MASITLLGKEFPLEYTVQVMEEMTKRFGGTAEAVESMSSGDKQLENTIFLLSAMMKGAERRERVRCALWHEEFKGAEAPDYETLMQIMNPEDLRNMANCLIQAINEANMTTTELAPDAKKNEVTQ